MLQLFQRILWSISHLKEKKIKKVSKNGKCFIVRKIDCSESDHSSIYQLGAHYLEQ